jgi:hypothetical protein
MFCSLPPSNSDIQEIIVENDEVSQTAETLLGGSGIANNIKQSHIIIILIFLYIILYYYAFCKFLL